MEDQRVGRIENHFFLITILTVCALHKGMLALLEISQITINYRSIYSSNFIIMLIMIMIEFILVGFTLLGAIELRKEYQYIRIICSAFLILTALISMFGIIFDIVT